MVFGSQKFFVITSNIGFNCIGFVSQEESTVRRFGDGESCSCSSRLLTMRQGGYEYLLLILSINISLVDEFSSQPYLIES